MTKATDKRLATLVHLKKLRKVWLGETRTSNAAVARLMKAIPKFSVSREDQ